MKEMLFILNPAAGRTHIKNRLFDVINAFSEADYRVTVFPTRQPNDGRSIVISEGSDYDVIVCAGGDGTLDDVVTGFMLSKCEKPLGYIPAGSTNDFARSLGIPLEPMAAVTNITSGHPFPIDVGSFNSHDYFIYVAAFGAFTEISYSTDQQVKNMFGHAAYIMKGIRSLNNVTTYQATIRYDDVEITDNFIYAMITNSLSVGGMRNVVLADDVKFDDGIFECLLIKTPTNPIELQAIINSLLISEVNDKYMYCFKAARIEIISEEEIPWVMDGEFGGEHKEVVIENHQKALQIIR
ncbi:MAG: diacylglycerol kinase family lipid kinase [Bacteroides sp.]|nr:diacylglycerol kinase family lipid kinase [Bacteroides sp.]MCM1548719.1 diacylglycerol kinase family lipid kinase [Clostridium sp.]